MTQNIENNIKKRTIYFDDVYFSEGFSVVGPKELKGKLGDHFDFALINDKYDQKTFEKAERKMFETAIDGVMAKSKVLPIEVDAILGGDLLDQIVSTSFSARKSSASFFGMYTACATYAQSLIMGAALIHGYYNNVICISGSHFSSAERQYRYPLELGVLRSPMTQWTCTGVGATLLTKNAHTPNTPKITAATPGRVIDYDIKDVNNMGAAMAPAACDTLKQFFSDTGKSPQDFDLILTGDLGKLGKEILLDLSKQEGFDLTDNLADCGASLYFTKQKTFQGGSGAACSAIVVNSIILDNLRSGQMRNLLLVGTGALMSQLTAYQGDGIPAVAHLVEITSSVKDAGREPLEKYYQPKKEEIKMKNEKNAKNNNSKNNNVKNKVNNSKSDSKNEMKNKKENKDK